MQCNQSKLGTSLYAVNAVSNSRLPRAADAVTALSSAAAGPWKWLPKKRVVAAAATVDGFLKTWGRLNGRPPSTPGKHPVFYLSIIPGMSCAKDTVESPTAMMHMSLSEVT